MRNGCLAELDYFESQLPFLDTTIKIRQNHPSYRDEETKFVLSSFATDINSLQ
jgi:hypothetical protein